MRIVPVPESFAESARRSDAPRVRVDEPRSAPCRVCLEDAAPGEDVLLVRYAPFERDVAYATSGPIFVHAHRCTPRAPDAPPTDALEGRLLSVRAHAQDGTLLACDVSEGRALAALAARFFADARVAELHVHHARAGCYACRILR